MNDCFLLLFSLRRLAAHKYEIREETKLAPTIIGYCASRALCVFAADDEFRRIGIVEYKRLKNNNSSILLRIPDVIGLHHKSILISSG